MWVCPKCGKSVRDLLDMCHNCGAANRPARAADSPPEPQVLEPPELPDLPEPDLPDPPDFQEAADLHQEADLPRESVFPGISTSSDGLGLNRELETPEDLPAAIVSRKPSKRSRKVTFRCFRGRWKSWHELFEQAGNFAGTVGPQRLISISHSADQSDGLVTVWYWTE